MKTLENLQLIIQGSCSVLQKNVNDLAKIPKILVKI